MVKLEASMKIQLKNQLTSAAGILGLLMISHSVASAQNTGTGGTVQSAVGRGVVSANSQQTAFGFGGFDLGGLGDLGGQAFGGLDGLTGGALGGFGDAVQGLTGFDLSSTISGGINDQLTGLIQSGLNEALGSIGGSVKGGANNSGSGDGKSGLPSLSTAPTPVVRDDLVRMYVETFRALYGDVIMDNSRGAGIFRFRYINPIFSVPDYIEQLRNGTSAQSGEKCSINALGAQFCVQTDTRIRWGVCPALRCLVNDTCPEGYKGYKFPFYELSKGQADKLALVNKLKQEVETRLDEYVKNNNILPEDKNKYINQITEQVMGEMGQEFNDQLKGLKDSLKGSAQPGGFVSQIIGYFDEKDAATNLSGSANKDESEELQTLRMWTEASLGLVLDASDIQTLRDPSIPLGQRNRYIDAFCDASAVAAFKRFHLRMRAVGLDHLTMNMTITPQQKSMMQRLIDRVSENLQMAETDAAASARLELMNENIRQVASLIKANRQISADAAIKNQAIQTGQLADLAQFGGLNPSSLQLLAQHSKGQGS